MFCSWRANHANTNLKKFLIWNLTNLLYLSIPSSVETWKILTNILWQFLLKLTFYGGSIQFFSVNTSRLSIIYVAVNKDFKKLPLDKDEHWLWSGSQEHRSCHSNEMTPLPVWLAAIFLVTGNCSSKIVRGNFFLQKSPRCLWSLSAICKSVIKIFWDKVFIVRYTVKMDNLDVWPLSVEHEVLLTCNFTSQ